MGKVIVKNVILRNHQDENAVELGLDRPIREIQHDMIADTGTVEIGLPQSLVDELGLPFEKEVDTKLADGSIHKQKMYRDLTVCIGDRKAYVPCIAKPEGAPLLLGQTVLEHMALVVDCHKQRLLSYNSNEMMLFEDY